MTHGPDGDEGDLLRLDAAQLRARFSARTRPGRAVPSRVMRAAILQVATENRRAAEAGQPPAFQGHVRALWHRLPEPLLARLGPAEQPRDPYAEMVEVLSDLVFEERALRYSDLCLTDPNWEERRIGPLRPDIVVVGEKRGLFRTLRRIHDRFGVTVCVTGGFPSGVSSETTARHVLEAAGPSRPQVRVVSVMDWDPTSALIEATFCRHLEHFGLRVVQRVGVFRPEHVPPEILALAARPIPSAGRRAPIVARWLAETGGIAGQPLRVDVDVLLGDELETLIATAVGGLLGG